MKLMGRGIYHFFDDDFLQIPSTAAASEPTPGNARKKDIKNLRRKMKPIFDSYELDEEEFFGVMS